MTCPEGDELIALSDGELGENRARSLRAHVDECTRCRAALAELTTIADDLRARVPGALGGKSAEAFADDVLARLDQPRAAPASRLPRWAMMLAAAAALPIVATFALRSSRSSSDAWSARGSATETSTVKRTLLRFGRVVETTFVPISDGAVVPADALLAAEVGGTEGAPRYLLAFLVDAAGERHWIYPVYEPGAPPPSSTVLPSSAAPRVLGSMVRLDHPAPGPGQLVAIVLPRRESVEHIEHVSQGELSRERLEAHYDGALVVVTRVEVRP